MPDQNSPTSTSEENPLPEDETKDVKGADESKDEGAELAGEAKEPKAPEPRVYSEEEWDKRQSSIDKQVADIKKQHDDAIAQTRKEYADTLAQLEAKQDAEFLSKIEAEGGDVEAGKRILARDQALRKREREVDDRERTMQAQVSQLGEVARQNDANRFAKEYGVDAEELLKANDPAEMERMALRLALEKAKTEAKKPVKTDSGVPSAKGVDWSKLTPDQKLVEGLKDMQL